MERSTLFKAAGIMAVGMLFIPVGDTAGKLMAGQALVAPVFIAWSRFALGALFIFAIMSGRQFDFYILRDWRIWFRGALLASGVTCILTALKTEPIANVFAAFFIGPILSYFLAAWLLRETITWQRTILLLIGFCGVLLVVKPGFDFSTGMGWALLAGMFYGCFLVATRWLAQVANARSLLISHLIIGTILLMPWSVTSMPHFTPDLTILIFISAIGSAVGNLLYVVANRIADASRLAPLVYVQLVSATILGILMFDDWPDILSMTGLALLLGSGLLGFLLKARSA